MCDMKILGTLSTPIKAPSAIAVNDTDELMALGDYYSDDVAIVDLSNGRTVHTYRNDEEAILSLFYVSHDLYCVSTNRQELSAYLVNLRSSERTRLPGEKLFDAAACTFPKKIALSWAYRINLVDLESKSTVGYLDGHDDVIDSLAFDKSGELLASASADYTVKLWHVDSGEIMRSFELEGVHSVALSPLGDLLIAGYAAGQVVLWRLGEERERSHSFSSEYAVSAICFGERGKRFYAARWDGSVSICGLQ